MKCKLCTFCIFDSPSNACLILSSQQPLGWATLCKLIWYSVQGRPKKREKWGNTDVVGNPSDIRKQTGHRSRWEAIHGLQQIAHCLYVQYEIANTSPFGMRKTAQTDCTCIQWTWPQCSDIPEGHMRRGWSGSSNWMMLASSKSGPIRILPIFRDECVYVALPCWNLSVAPSNQSQGGGGSKHSLSYFCISFVSIVLKVLMERMCHSIYLKFQ